MDRLFWVWLYRLWPQALHAIVLVKPATVVGWHRKGFRLYWRWKSKSGAPGRPKTSKEIRDLIRQMSIANKLWGAPRLHGELLKLGIVVSQATVGRYMPWRPKVPSPQRPARAGPDLAHRVRPLTAFALELDPHERQQTVGDRKSVV